MRAVIGEEIKAAKRRCAMKRWLRARGIRYSNHATYNEAALRKLVRDHSAKPATGGAHAE